MGSQVIQSDNPAISPAKSMKGKYDKRKNNGDAGRFTQYGAKAGPTPKWLKNLSRNKSTTYLEQCDAIKTPAQMFQEAIEAKSYALAWQIRQDLENRAYGRPYVQINPAEKERHGEADVSRIAVAIKNLQIVQTPELPALTKGKQLAASPTIDAEPSEESDFDEAYEKPNGH
jgi:hypothetical protein